MNLTKLASLQLDDGSFGFFHSMSKDSTLTTEKVLRRCMFLDIDKSNSLLNNILIYVKRCLNREIETPDRKEKVLQWHHFENLMFTAWLNIFDDLNEKAKEIKSTWVSLIESSIKDNYFDFDLYKTNYQIVFGSLKSGQRVIDPTCFYVVTLVKDKLSNKVSKCYFDYIMEKGIYYIYSKSLNTIPEVFDHQNTLSYLYAISLTASFNPKSSFLSSVKLWILNHQDQNGYWNLNNIKTDGVMLPISNNWKRRESKLNDIKKFMEKVLNNLP